MGCVELVVGMDRGDNYGINRRTCVWEREGWLLRYVSEKQRWKVENS